MRKFILCLSIALFFLAPSNNALAFYNDVFPTNQYYNSIKALYDKELLPQTTSFRPNDTLTNAELYEMLISFSEISLAETVNLPYNDTQNETQYAPYLQTALNLGILSSQPTNPKFEPDKYLTKYKVLEVMFKTLDIGTNYFFDRTSFPFADINATSNLSPLAQKTADIGIIEPSNPNFFKMAKRITRGEAADYLYKINQYKKLDTVEVTYTFEPSSFLEGNMDSYYFNDKEQELIDHKSFGTLLDVWQTLKSDYLYKDTLNDSDLIFGAIEGMVNQVDDTYTVFEKPGEDTILSSLSSEFEGIGVSIEMIDGKITIISPLKNSPAETVGLQPNDVIIKVNGEDIQDQTLSKVVSKIKGPAGTAVQITISRNNQELTYTITRNALFYETVSYKFMQKGAKKIAYLELKSFNDKTFEEFLKAAQEIVAEKADGLILDLRNNPGGYMDVAINIIDLFTNKSKTAVKMKFADNSVESYKTDGNGLLKGMKTVVLINKGSASASEILAGALQDYKAATIIGEKSFGKGTVQDIAEYKDESIFKYTTAQWLTPNGRDINKKGITPDKYILKTTHVDTQLKAALEEF